MAVERVDPTQLTRLARDHACLIVASGRAGLSELFVRIPEHSPFREPQRRILAVLCAGLRPSAPVGLTIQVVPGRGELLDFPLLREEGRVGCINLQAVPGGPFEAMARMPHDDDPAAFRAALLALVRAHAPLTWPRIDPGEFDVLGPSHVLQGGITQTVRRGLAALGDGRFTIALGDAHITHDPIGAQGANAASRAAWILGQRIVAHLAAGRPFDAEFHAQAEHTLWQAMRAATEWSNVLLRPPSRRFVDLLVAVSTAVLIVYTYPIWVGLIARLTRGEPLGGARVIAIVLAFAGVAIALDVHASAMPDARGLALAGLAAIGMAAMVLGSGRLVRDIDPGAINFYLSAAATGIFAVLLVVGGPHLPHSALGELGFAGLLVTFPLAQLALLAAVDRAGPVVTAVVMNLEPLITIGLAVIVLGERVSAIRLGGAALVVAAIAIMRRSRATP